MTNISNADRDRLARIIFDAENNGMEFIRCNDGWYWLHSDDRANREYYNGPFPTKDAAACDALSGADYIDP